MRALLFCRNKIRMYASLTYISCDYFKREPLISDLPPNPSQKPLLLATTFSSQEHFTPPLSARAKGVEWMDKRHVHHISLRKSVPRASSATRLRTSGSSTGVAKQTPHHKQREIKRQDHAVYCVNLLDRAYHERCLISHPRARDVMLSLSKHPITRNVK